MRRGPLAAARDGSMPREPHWSPPRGPDARPRKRSLVGIHVRRLVVERAGDAAQIGEPALARLLPEIVVLVRIGLQPQLRALAVGQREPGPPKALERSCLHS